MKRLFAVLMSIVLCISLFPVSAFALTQQEQEDIYRVQTWWQDKQNKECVDWLLDSDNFLYHRDVTEGDKLHELTYAMVNSLPWDREDNYVDILTGFLTYSYESTRQKAVQEAKDKAISCFFDAFRQYLMEEPGDTIETIEIIVGAINLTENDYLSRTYIRDEDKCELTYDNLLEQIKKHFHPNNQEQAIKDMEAHYEVFTSSNEWQDAWEEYSVMFSIVGHTVDILLDSLDVAIELESYSLANDKYIALITLISENAEDPELIDACEEVESKLLNDFATSFGKEFVAIVGKEAGQLAFDALIDFAAEASLVVRAAKMGIDAGLLASKWVFNTDDLTKYMQQVYCLNEISEVLVSRLQKEWSNLHYFDRLEPASAEYSSRVIYHLQMLSRLRKLGEDNFYKLKNSAFDSFLGEAICLFQPDGEVATGDREIELWYAQFSQDLADAERCLFGEIPSYYYYDESLDTDANTGDQWEGYIPISTKEELNAIRDNPDGKYYLVNNIIFTDLDFIEGGTYYNFGRCWDPIDYFSGVFDGNGYGIFGLQCSVLQTGAYQVNTAGLFGYVTGAVIKNLTVSDGVIYCEKNSSQLAYAGGIAAFCHNTTFINCHNENDVQGYNVGGIAGACHGGEFENCTNSGTISNVVDDGYQGGIVGTTSCNDPSCETVTMAIKGCKNYGNICGGDVIAVGGIAGATFYSEIQVEHCANYGSVGSNATSYAGGVIGTSRNDTIRYCYNAADVSGTNSGGILGNNGYDEEDISIVRDCYNCGDIYAYGSFAYAGGISGGGGRISRCYNVGQITASATQKKSVAGIATSRYAPVYVTNCYSIDNDDFVITSGVSLCTEAEMKDSKTYQGFDFDTIWGCGSETNDGYPYLLDVLSVENLSGAELVLLPEYDDNVISKGSTRVLQVQLHVDGQVVKDTMLSDGFDYLITTSDGRVVQLEYAEQHTDGVAIAISGVSVGYATIRITERSTGSVYTVEIEVKTHEEVGDHSYSDWYTVVGKTCTTDGQVRRDCAICDYYETKVISAIGHDYTSVVTAPTCTKQGYTTHTCSTCGDSYVDSYVDAVGHSYVMTDSKDATCEEDGYITYTCHCGDSYTEVIEATGHSYVDGVCENCGEADPDAVLMGDVNGDGVVNYLDAMLIAQYYVGDIEATDLNLDAADVNGDGVVNYLDAMMVAQFYVGDIDSFPVGN